MRSSLWARGAFARKRAYVSHCGRMSCFLDKGACEPLEVVCCGVRSGQKYMRAFQARMVLLSETLHATHTLGVCGGFWGF